MCRTAFFVRCVVLILTISTRSHTSLICSPWSTVNFTDAQIFYNGSAWDAEDKVLYPPNAYWTTTDDGRTIVYGCPCKLDKPCLRKCCAKDKAMNTITQECEPYKKPWPWFRPRVSADEMLTQQTADVDHFRLMYGTICLGYLLEPTKYPEDQFFLNFTDGTLSIPSIKKTGIDSSGFCLEYLPETGRYRPFVCLNEVFPNGPLEYCDQLREVVYPLGISVSIFFLLISLAVYTTTAELRNLHGYCLICHIVSLLGAYVIHLTSRGIRENLSSVACKALGFVVYYGLLSSFLWLNTICIDICIRFSQLRRSAIHCEEDEAKKFHWYILYAWGLPLLIIIITATLAFHPDLSESFLGPEFRTICGYYRGNSRLAYFVVPMGIIVLLNIILFSITIYNIHKITSETSILRGEGNAMTRADRERKNLFVKLMILMGISWVFGSWVLEMLNYFYGTTSCMWLFTDTLNAMQGLLVFIIFICKNNVRRLMRKKMRNIVSLVAPNAPTFLMNMVGTGETSTTPSRTH